MNLQMNLERSPEQSGKFSIHKIQIDPDWFQDNLDNITCFSLGNTIAKSTRNYTIVGHFSSIQKIFMFSRSIWITIPLFEIQIYLKGASQSRLQIRVQINISMQSTLYWATLANKTCPCPVWCLKNTETIYNFRWRRCRVAKTWEHGEHALGTYDVLRNIPAKILHLDLSQGVKTWKFRKNTK